MLKRRRQQFMSTRDESLNRGSRGQKVTVERNKKGSMKKRGTKFEKKDKNE
jgi:hypothetical protein